jgi:hypothetical protein
MKLISNIKFYSKDKLQYFTVENVIKKKNKRLTVFRILEKKETLRQTLIMTSHTVILFINKNVSSLLRHERIFDYHNNAFLQISKKILKLKDNIFMKTMFLNAEK